MAKMVHIQNLKKKPAAADFYNHIKVTVEDGTVRHLLFTDNEVERAIQRASKNPEDLPSTSWFRDWF